MALLDLAAEYQHSANLLKDRLALLRKELKAEKDPAKAFRLKRRIAELTPMLTEMNELAEMTARYYDPSYYRNAKYSSNCFDDPVTKHTACVEYAPSTNNIEKEIET